MKSFSYPAGWPLWRQLARHNVPIRIEVMVLHDVDANVFVARDSNLRGLVAEAPTMDELVKNVDAAIKDLMVSYLHEPLHTQPITSLTFTSDCAFA